MITYLKPFDETSAKKIDLDLIEAAMNGRTKEVINLLGKGANKDFIGRYGRTALHWSAENGHKETAKALLERGANTDINCNDGTTALQRAIIKNHLETVNTFLDPKYNVNVDLKSTFGRTPLHMASVAGFSEIVKALLKRKAKVTLKDLDGRTALDLASQYLETSTIGLLTEYHGKERLKNDPLGKMEALTIVQDPEVSTSNNNRTNTQQEKNNNSTKTIKNYQKKQRLIR